MFFYLPSHEFVRKKKKEKEEEGKVIHNIRYKKDKFEIHEQLIHQLSNFVSVVQF